MKPLFRLLALAALLLAPSMGSAQGPSAEEIARQATAEFQAANYDEAAILFQQAFNIDPDPILLFNLARAHQEMGDLPTALTLYLELVELTDSQRVRTAAQGKIAEVEASLRAQGYEPGEVTPLDYVPRGALSITSVPAGAAVFLGGNFVGVTPYTEPHRDAGEYRLQLELEGFHPVVATVVVSAGIESVRDYALNERADLDEYVPPTPGFLSVRGAAPGLPVEIDGELRGFTPLEGVRLAPGQYLVSVRGEGWEPYTTTVEVFAAGEETVFAQMEREVGFDARETAGLRYGGIALMSVGAAATVGGLSLGLLANQSAAEYRSDPASPNRRALRDEARGRALGADVALFTGVAALTSGAVMTVIAAKKRDRWTRDLLVSPGWGPQGPSVALLTRF